MRHIRNALISYLCLFAAPLFPVEVSPVEVTAVESFGGIIVAGAVVELSYFVATVVDGDTALGQHPSMEHDVACSRKFSASSVLVDSRQMG